MKWAKRQYIWMHTHPKTTTCKPAYVCDSYTLGLIDKGSHRQCERQREWANVQNNSTRLHISNAFTWSRWCRCCGCCCCLRWEVVTRFVLFFFFLFEFTVCRRPHTHRHRHRFVWINMCIFTVNTTPAYTHLFSRRRMAEKMLSRSLFAVRFLSLSMVRCILHPK